MRPLRRSPSRPSCRYSSPASRFPPRPSDTISGEEGGSGVAGRPAACSAGRRTGRAVSSLLSYVMCSCGCLLHACLGSPAAMPLFVSTPLIRSVSAWCRRSPVPVMPAVLYRPAHRHEKRGAERGECLLDDADRMICVGLKKRAGFSFPVRLLWLYRLYKPW